MKHFYLCCACILFGAASCAKGTQSLGTASTEGGSGGGAQSGASSTSTGQGGVGQVGASQAAAGQGGAGQTSTGQGGAGQASTGQGGTGQASTGQGGSGDPCAPDPGDTECDVCRKQSCCVELAACAGSTVCTCWVECIDMHPTDPNNTVTCSALCGAPGSALTQINGVFNCQQACLGCPPVPWA